MMRKQILLAALAIFISFLNGAAQETGNPSVPKTVSGGVLNGRAISLPKPAYPAAALAVRASGAVNVQVTIDEEGNVISAMAVSGHPLLRSSSVEAARQAKFKPTILSGIPVKVTGVIVYNFTLPETGPKKSKTEILLPVGLSMFLTALKDIEPDEDIYNILREMSDSLPNQFASEKAQFKKLTTAKRSEQIKIIDDLIGSLGKNLTGSDAWLFNFGKYWGGALGQAYKIGTNQFQGDKMGFVGNMKKMYELLESPPADISEDILDKLREVGSYSDEEDLVTREFITDFTMASIKFIEFLTKKEVPQSNETFY